MMGRVSLGSASINANEPCSSFVTQVSFLKRLDAYFRLLHLSKAFKRIEESWRVTTLDLYIRRYAERRPYLMGFDESHIAERLYSRIVN